VQLKNNKNVALEAFQSIQAHPNKKLSNILTKHPHVRKLFFKKLSVTANIPSSLYNENLALLFAKCNEPDKRGSWSMIFI